MSDDEEQYSSGDSLSKRLIGIVSEHLGLDENEVTLKARFVEDLGADAQDHEELVSRMEKEFDVDIPLEYAKKITNADTATRYIKRRLKK